MADMNYNGQITEQDTSVDVAKLEKGANKRARAHANNNPEADLASAAESASGDHDPDATLMS